MGEGAVNKDFYGSGARVRLSYVQDASYQDGKEIIERFPPFSANMVMGFAMQHRTEYFEQAIRGDNKHLAVAQGQCAGSTDIVPAGEREGKETSLHGKERGHVLP